MCQIEHLGTVFPDRVQGAAAAGAGLLCDIHHHLGSWQMRRQRSPVPLRR